MVLGIKAGIRDINTVVDATVIEHLLSIHNIMICNCWLFIQVH